MPQPRHLRVFVSSPADVKAERVIAAEVLGKLPYDPLLRGRITVEIVAWDGPVGRIALDASITPQEAIARGLPRPSECDVVIVILWRRLGTPLSASIRRPDGSRYASGTEWEFEDALNAARPPAILVYRRTGGDEQEPSLDRDIDAAPQPEQVERFFARFANADGSLCLGSNIFTGPTDFARQLEFHLREVVGRLLALDVATQSEGSVAQAMRLDSAMRRRSVLGAPEEVRVQVCLPTSAGLLRGEAEAETDDASRPLQTGTMPVLFRRDARSGQPQPTSVEIEVFAPDFDPAHARQELLVVPAFDSGVLGFVLVPRRTGAATLRIALRQCDSDGAWVTSGIVTLQTMIAEAGCHPPCDEVMQLVSRLLGSAKAAIAAGADMDGAATTPLRITLKVVEEPDRRRIEKYLTLEVPLLRSMLVVSGPSAGRVAYHQLGQDAAGDALFAELRPVLVRRLRNDEALFAYLREHAPVSPVDLVALIEERIAVDVPEHSARIAAAIIVRMGLFEFLERPRALPATARP